MAGVTDIEQEACALRAAICGCGNGEDSHPEGRNPADDEMVARIMKAGFRRPASPATRGTVTEEMVEAAAISIRADIDVCGDDRGCECEDAVHTGRIIARNALEAALTEKGDD